MKLKLILGSILAASLYSGSSMAGKCVAPDVSGEVSEAAMTEFYQCIQPTLQKGYGKKGDEVGSAYTSWKNASKFPAAPGVHSGQHLMTYVNDIGFDDYVKYGSGPMPIGTVIAKESFTIKSGGKWKMGPLLIMTKVGDEAAATGGWAYSGVKKNGKVLSVDGPGFCHACHQAYAGQDFLGYPVPAARVN